MDDDEKPKPQSLEMLNADEAAPILGLSRSQVYRLVKQRLVPHVKLGGCIRFERGVLETWVREQMMKGVSSASTQARQPVDGGLRVPRLVGGPDPIAPVSWGGRHVKAGR